MEFFALVFILALDFLLTAFGYWLVTLVLGVMGVAVTFTWGWAFAIWVIIKIIKLCT